VLAQTQAGLQNCAAPAASATGISVKRIRVTPALDVPAWWVKALATGKTYGEMESGWSPVVEPERPPPEPASV
jgi:hypothetical protein